MTQITQIKIPNTKRPQMTQMSQIKCEPVQLRPHGSSSKLESMARPEGDFSKIKRTRDECIWTTWRISMSVVMHSLSAAGVLEPFATRSNWSKKLCPLGHPPSSCGGIRSASSVSSAAVLEEIDLRHLRHLRLF